MKRIYTLLVSSFFSLSLLANDGGRLSISTAGNTSDLKIEIDGQGFILENNRVILSNLAEGYHDVKIYRDVIKNIFGFDKGDIMYSNAVYLKRGFEFAITINRFRTVMVDERHIDRSEGSYYENNNSNSGRGYTASEKWGSEVMSDREFDQVKYAISKEWFENNRMISARTIMDNNYFTTCQVKEFMQLFSYENNKLEVAKYAYRKTVDKENYDQINDAFSCNSSKEELARFIRECR